MPLSSCAAPFSSVSGSTEDAAICEIVSYKPRAVPRGKPRVKRFNFPCFCSRDTIPSIATTEPCFVSTRARDFNARAYVVTYERNEPPVAAVSARSAISVSLSSQNTTPRFSSLSRSPAATSRAMISIHSDSVYAPIARIIFKKFSFAQPYLLLRIFIL